MRRLRAVLIRIRSLFAAERLDRELADELEAHLQAQVADHVRAGMTPEAARRAALLTLGGLEPTKEYYRQQRGVPLVDTIVQDARYALRTFRRSPGFSTIAALTLALGLGATTAIVTLLHVVLLKPLPVRDAHELFLVSETAPEEGAESGSGPGRRIGFSYPRFIQLEHATGAGESLAAMSRVTRFTFRLAGNAPTSVVQGQLVSGRYFDTFGIVAAAGRMLRPEDFQRSEPAAAVISDRLWRRRFAGAADVIGGPVFINGVPVSIVGIAPAGFDGAWLESPVEIWMPISLQNAVRYRGNASSHNSDETQPWESQLGIEWLNIVGRAAVDQHTHVWAELAAANQPGLAELADLLGDETEKSLRLRHALEVEPFGRGFSDLREQSGKALIILTAFAALVLLVACSNVANLLLARAITRHREMGIRMSLGATRRRLIGQCATESLVLAAIGGGLGFVVSRWMSRVLASTVLNVSNDAFVAGLAPDSSIIGFAILVSIATALAFGAWPAVRVGRVECHGALSAGVRGMAEHSARGMTALVAAQLALSFVLVTATALLGRSLLNLSRLDPGFEREHLVTVAMDPVASGYTHDEWPVLYRRLQEVVSLPGVTTAAVASCGLVNNCQNSGNYQFDGYQPAPNEIVRAQENRVGPAYFETVGVQVVDGRAFNERDTSERPLVAVVNESVVRRYFGGVSPVGRRLGYGTPDTEIVGVVRDARVTNLRSAPIPMVYRPINQIDRGAARSLEVRTRGDAARTATAVREALRQTEPRLLVDRVRTIDQQLASNIARDRGVAALISGLGLLALFLAGIGLYGVTAFAVARRTHELGIRLALGATPAVLMRMVLGNGLRVALAGVLMGTVLAALTGRFLESVLFDVPLLEPLTYALVGAVLTAATLAACYLPGRRAARLDPAAALRHE